METKKIIAIVLAAVIAVAIYGAYQFPVVIQQISVGSPAGSSFSNAKFAGTVASLTIPGSTGTSTSILNGDASNRYVMGVKVGCTGLGTSQTAYSGTGLAALTLTVATSSTASPVTNGNTNRVTTPITIATSTGTFAFASSTATLLATTSVNGSVGVSGGSTDIGTVWASNSYMTFTTNATNTAACTFGVDYIGA